MSTKRLQRTVIEGGRRNVYERRKSSKELRAAERAYLTRINQDWENWDEEAEPEITPVWKEFSDKLSPMYRWLDAQVGRVWADVRSEVFTKFDIRTTAGRHITFDHLLGSVVDTLSGFNRYGYIVDPDIEVEHTKGAWRRYYDYYVDQSGILRKHDSDSRRRYYKSYTTEAELQESAKWLNNNIVGLKDGKYYWFCPTEGIWKAEWEKNAYGYTYLLKYYYRDNGHYTTKTYYSRPWGNFSYEHKHHGDFWNPIDVPFGYRQRGELSDKDVKYLNSLNERVRDQILSYGKNR